MAKDKGLTMITDLTKTETPYVNTVIVGLRRYVKENPQLIDTFLKASSMPRSYAQSLPMKEPSRAFSRSASA